MKISTNALQAMNSRYGSAQNSEAVNVPDLVQRIGAQLGAVEEVTPFGDKFVGVLIVKVVSCEAHPNADKLHICLVDDGGKAEAVERDERGYVQVVCGAPNVRAGMLAAWLPPGSTVPLTFYDPEKFVLEVRELRGVKSNGMLASPKELSLGESHEGLLEIDGGITPGTSFVDAYQLRDDTLIDMENKMFTHRPDCFGWLGIAREIEGIYHRPYVSPSWYRLDAEVSNETGVLPLEVRNELPELVPRFTAITMQNVTVGPSPVWLQLNLVRAGIRPINNIVDYTNWYMLLTGQPLHAYDYDKVRMLDHPDGTEDGSQPAVLTVRHPHKGETLTLLNGKSLEPREQAIMIATENTIIGVGGVMGGNQTEVDTSTKNIIIECATFDMYSVRRTSMAHGLFTDAVTRFNKGQSPLQTWPVILQIAKDISETTGGTIGTVVDHHEKLQDMMVRGSVHEPVATTPSFINARLGLTLSAEEIQTLLQNVEFTVSTKDDQLEIAAPFWRTDIEISEDIVEEVGRLYGYDQLPLELPKRDIEPATVNVLLQVKSRIREVLSRAGANEVLTYSFVHGHLLDKVGQDRALAFQLSNALSPDLQYYRLSLTPSLLEKVHANIKTGHSQFALFELGKAHIQGKSDPQDPNLPQEFNTLAFTFAAESKVAQQLYQGAPYYQARQYLMHLLQVFRIEDIIQLHPLRVSEIEDNAWLQQITAPFAPSRSAFLRDTQGRTWGVLGEYKASVRKALKLPDYAAGFELGPFLLTQGQQQSGYMPLSRFPKVEQDICLRVNQEISYQTLLHCVQEALEVHKPAHTYTRLFPIDIYQREDDLTHKQVTFRLSIASYDKTLTDSEVVQLLDQVAQTATEQLQAERI